MALTVAPRGTLFVGIAYSSSRMSSPAKGSARNTTNLLAKPCAHEFPPRSKLPSAGVLSSATCPAEAAIGRGYESYGAKRFAGDIFPRTFPPEAGEEVVMIEPMTRWRPKVSLIWVVPAAVICAQTCRVIIEPTSTPNTVLSSEREPAPEREPTRRSIMRSAEAMLSTAQSATELQARTFKPLIPPRRPQGDIFIIKFYPVSYTHLRAH